MLLASSSGPPPPSELFLYTWGNGQYNNLGHGYSEPLASWTQVTIGGSSVTGFGLAIRSDGKLFGWGSNLDGQCGTDGGTYVSRLVQVGTSNWTSVVSGTNHTLAIKSGGTLWAWGLNTSGQLGDGTVTSRSSPVQIGALTNWVHIAAGVNSLAIRSDGKLFGWGPNTNGTIGDGTNTNQSSPVQIGTSSWVAVSAGASHCAAIRFGGNLFTWGSNSWKAIGADLSVVDSWTQISHGNSYTLAIRSDGKLFGWGLNSNGQLGLGDRVSRSAPAQIGTSNWHRVSAGLNTSLAIRSDKTLWVWGNGNTGKLANGVATDLRSSPIQIGTSANWVDITAGYSHLGAIKGATLGATSGTLFMWGAGGTGRLGNGSNVNRSSPVQVGALTDWKSIRAGGTHTVAIRTGGQMYAWGVGTSGRVGDGNNLSKSSPVQIGAASNWTQIAAGKSHSIAMTTLGRIHGWGLNSSGQLGDGTNLGRSAPTAIGISSWVAISTGRTFSHAIKVDGTLWAWGQGAYLGQNNNTNRNSPVQIGTDTWSSLGGGVDNIHMHAITTGSIAYAWGTNNQGALGRPEIGTFVTIASPIVLGGEAPANSPVQIGTSTWSAVSVGRYATYAIRSDSKLFSWGSNFSAQLGLGDYTTRESPVQVGTANWSKIAKLAGNFDGCMGIQTDNTLWGWGSNINGQMGSGIQISVQYTSPVQIGTSTNWVSINCADVGSIALNNTATNLYQWGSGWSTALNGGELIPAILVPGENILEPSKVSALSSLSWNSVNTGAFHSAAIRSDGALFMWGRNEQGQIGNASLTRVYSPIQIGTSSWSVISCGERHSAGITSDGKLFTWGYNLDGQLGNGQNGAIFSTSSPVQVGLSSWSVVSCGNSFTMGITDNKRMFGWGYGVEGQLGIGLALARRSSPVQVGALASWVHVEAGGESALALRSTTPGSGSLWSWGQGAGGRLGISTLSNTISPVQIGVGFLYKSIGVGQLHAGAVRTDGTLWMWGTNTSGQLGNSTTFSTSSPIQIGAAIGSWKSIHAGNATTLGITMTNDLYSWGNPNGPSGWTGFLSSPVQIGNLGSQTVEDSWDTVSLRGKALHALGLRINK